VKGAAAAMPKIKYIERGGPRRALLRMVWQSRAAVPCLKI
jgi:hypothetical protein